MRALVMRPDDAVLLVHFEFPNGTRVWAAPGGGIELGESPEEAVRRELAEEVGIHQFALGPQIWTRTHLFALAPEFDGQREQVFLVRIDEEPGRPTMTDEELRAEFVTGSRWWSASELASSSEPFAPNRLPELVSQLLTHGPPHVPWDAGV